MKFSGKKHKRFFFQIFPQRSLSGSIPALLWWRRVSMGQTLWLWLVLVLFFTAAIAEASEGDRLGTRVAEKWRSLAKSYSVFFTGREKGGQTLQMASKMALKKGNDHFNGAAKNRKIRGSGSSPKAIHRNRILEVVTERNEKIPMIQLRSWQISLGEGWRTTEPIFWEAPLSEGGIHTEQDGIGIYRSCFYLPDSWQKWDLGFFVRCLDDADRFYVNGTFIGETGWIPPLFRFPFQGRNITQNKPDNPEQSWMRDGRFPGQTLALQRECRKHENSVLCRNAKKDFRSGTRLARFYHIPQKLLRYGDSNCLHLMVYDYAGVGGFCYKHYPLVGQAVYLKGKRDRYQSYNDLPRVILIVILVVLWFAYARNLRGRFLSVSFWRHLALAFGDAFTLSKNFFHRHMLQEENPLLAVNPASAQQVRRAKEFRIVLLLLSFIMYIFFLLSELPNKYVLLGSEAFWFKAPPIVFFVALMLQQLLFHVDVFGSIKSASWGRSPKKWLELLLFALSSPLLTVGLLVYTFALPADQAWAFFVVSGLYFVIFVNTVLFAASGLNMILYGVRSSNKKLWWSLLPVWLRPKAKKPGSSSEDRRNTGSPPWLRDPVQAYFARKAPLEGGARIVLALAYIVGIVVFLSQSELLPQGALIGIFFLTVFWRNMVRVLDDYAVLLPVRLTRGERLVAVLQEDYGLTEHEAGLALHIYEGREREDIIKDYGIVPSTLKSHMTKIYAKTLEADQEKAATDSHKWYRFKDFLNDLLR